MSLLVARDLKKTFGRTGFWGRVSSTAMPAVDDVHLALGEGETLAIVGESGSGKSTTARLIMRLIEPDAGRVELLGEDFTALSGHRLRRMRRHMQMVFQDPYASLTPRKRVGRMIADPMRSHGRTRRGLVRARTRGLLEQRGRRYRHQSRPGHLEAYEPPGTAAREPEGKLRGQEREQCSLAD